MKISPILIGVHNTQQEADGVLLPGHTGTVTLLQTESESILVDVGGRGTFAKVKEGLALHEISPEDINLIILTHLHLDHSYNLSYFPKAKIFAWNHDWRDGETMRFKDIEKVKLPEGIRIIRTPGHAQEHLCVLVEENGKTTAIVGDSFNEEYVKSGGVISTFCVNESLYHESAKKVLAISDVIIPGHGEPFLVDRLK